MILVKRSNNIRHSGGEKVSNMTKTTSSRSGNKVTGEVSPQVAALGKLKVDFSQVDGLPPLIRELISDPATFLDPRVLEYTRTNSVLAEILRTNPASDQFLRIVYTDANWRPLTYCLDRLISRSLSVQAVRDRLKFCSEWLAEHFVHSGARVVDLGGGSGSYAFEALRIKGTVPSGFVWDVLDLDQEALDIASAKAHDLGLSSVITVNHGNFLNGMSTIPADYIVLIGVLCGMSHTTGCAVLSRIKRHIRPRGEIFAATLLQQAFDEDPRTFRIVCNVGGWMLRPKSMDQVLELFECSGWDVLSVESERSGGLPGQYAIVHARAR